MKIFSWAAEHFGFISKKVPLKVTSFFPSGPWRNTDPGKRRSCFQELQRSAPSMLFSKPPDSGEEPKAPHSPYYLAFKLIIITNHHISESNNILTHLNFYWGSNNHGFFLNVLTELWRMIIDIKDSDEDFGQSMLSFYIFCLHEKMVLRVDFCI